MNFTEKLNCLMKEKNITRGILAEKTGIPYNTIVGFYTKGYHNIKLSNLKRLAEFFDISIDILSDDSKNLSENAESREKDLFGEKYRGLSKKGRNLVDNIVDSLLDMENPEKQEAEITYIREYVTPAAAGLASPAEGEDYILVEREKTVPKEADFAVRISGDSMEPYIKDGSRVYVSRTNELSVGDVGIFFVDGDMKCKQFCEDSFGNIYLFSLNRDRKEADMAIMASSGITVFCFGKVLLGKKVTLPKS